MSEVCTCDCLRLSSWQRICRSLVIKRIENLTGDSLLLIDHHEHRLLGNASDDATPIRVTIHNPRFYSRLLSGGPLGAAESLLDGDWSCNDLTRLVRLMIRNQVTLSSLDTGLSTAKRLMERVRHWLRRNTIQQSRNNIREHYDLGNEFFSLFLDPTMNYSSAIFDPLPGGHSESLQRAQQRKMQRLGEMLQLDSNDHLLEIGTGWGSMACYAAKNFGCRVTTTTISHEQFLRAKQRVAEEGLEDRVTVLERDYRLLQGRFDKILSVEMIEAVGDRFYETFFEKCQQLLKPEGLLLLQAITIVDQRYVQHLKSVDFICKYIFPGGSLPCISRLVSSAANAADMRLVQLNDYAGHYAETLRRWRTRFWNHIETVRALGYSERFIRMWDYYLAYCEAAFEERQINLVHTLFASRESKFDLTAVSEKNAFDRTLSATENSEQADSQMRPLAERLELQSAD